jgi:hypothetical protein
MPKAKMKALGDFPYYDKDRAMEVAKIGSLLKRNVQKLATVQAKLDGRLHNDPVRQLTIHG